MGRLLVLIPKLSALMSFGFPPVISFLCGAGVEWDILLSMHLFGVGIMHLDHVTDSLFGVGCF